MSTGHRAMVAASGDRWLAAGRREGQLATSVGAQTDHGLAPAALAGDQQPPAVGPETAPPIPARDLKTTAG